MTSTLTELMAKSSSELSAFESKVVESQNMAVAYKERFEEGIARLTGGKWRSVESPGKTEEELVMQIESQLYSMEAITTALIYLTEERKTPLTEKQYLDLQHFVILNHPRTIWDEGNWFRAFNKVVEENGIPVDDDVKSYMAQNEILFLEYSMKYAFEGGLGIKKEEVSEFMDNEIIKIDIDKKGNIMPVGKCVRSNMYSWVKSVYEHLKGNINPSEIN